MTFVIDPGLGVTSHSDKKERSMPHFHENAAMKLPESATYVPDVNNYLFKAFEQSEEELILSRLNYRLASQCGKEFRLEFFAGDRLADIPENTLFSLADCYAKVFNESWGESWTRESALEEIKNCIFCEEDFIPLMTIMFREEEVIGFSWGFVLEADQLTENSAPFSSSGLKRHESVEVAKYWLTEVAGIRRLLSIRELGVVKEYRQDKTPYLCLPIFEKSKSLECNVAFLRTKVSSKAFKWSLGIGFVPIQLFMVDGLLLMHGSIKYATNIFNGLVDTVSKRKSQQKVVTNIKRYLCQY